MVLAHVADLFIDAAISRAVEDEGIATWRG
jgi:hypothetical protein